MLGWVHVEELAVAVESEDGDTADAEALEIVKALLLADPRVSILRVSNEVDLSP